MSFRYALSKRRGALAAIVSAALHLLVGLGLVFLNPAGVQAPPAPPMDVALVELAPPPAAPRPDPGRVRSATPKRERAPHMAARVVDQAPQAALAASPSGALDLADLAGASDADSGAPAGGCDMARRLQGSLRRDPLVRAAVSGSSGKAILVWNGDWIQSAGEDGKGLAAVREAIMWEVAFAPQACRAQPMHGLILFSPIAAPGSARLAVGSRDWRWSDLLARR